MLMDLIPRFRQFGPDHLAVLAFLAVASAALAFNARRLRRVRDDRPFCYAFAIGLLANQLIAWIVYASRGVLLLPLDLCDVALFFIAWALAGSPRILSELAYFWGLAGSSQAVLTPDLWEGFPSYAWIRFFVSHCGTVLGAVYLAARGRVAFTPRSVWRVWGITNVYAGFAGLANWRLGTNFGYLAAKSAHPSLLDYLGPWPYYILSLEVIALALFYLCYALGQAIERRTLGPPAAP